MRGDLFVEVRTDILRENAARCAEMLGASGLIAVVKGGGFGHGTVLAGRAFVEGGAAMLGVTRLGEARELREAGIDAPVLVMVPPGPERADEARQLRVEVAVDTAESAEAYRGVPQHLKVDFGMGRLGVFPAGLADLRAASGGDAVAVFTHFPDAARGRPRGLDPFLSATADLGLLRHCANSAAACRVPESRLDMARLGTVLYGQKPWGSEGPAVESGWTLKARVVGVYERPAGATVGYGPEFVARGRTRIATLAVGTADGFQVAPTGPMWRMSPFLFALKKRKVAPYAMLRGRRCPVVGRVSMQLATVEIGDLSVEVGEWAEVPALRLMVGAHVPRVAAS